METEFLKIYKLIAKNKMRVLNVLEQVLDEELYAAFLASNDEESKGYYIIYRDDFPSVRDTKALLNMMTVVERISYAGSVSWTLALSCYEEIFVNFKVNHKLFYSTNSPLARYFFAKANSLMDWSHKMLDLLVDAASLYITVENLEKGGEWLIEKIIKLEQYQQLYLENKKNEAAGIVSEDKASHKENILTTFLRTSDGMLRKYFGKEYDGIFLRDPTKFYSYLAKDSDTIKNIKRLLNGITAIQLAIQARGEGITSSPAVVYQAYNAYIAFRDFDLEDIKAEQASPAANFLKDLLKSMQQPLEILACTLDRYEGEYGLKEGVLLKYLESFMQVYTSIMSELRIQVHYSQLKWVYRHARINSRREELQKIDSQLQQLAIFQAYKNAALTDIPEKILVTLLKYIKQYEDDISIDHDQLEHYKKYLESVIHAKNKGIALFVTSVYESVKNHLGLTTHSTLMLSLDTRAIHLREQRVFLEKRLLQMLKIVKAKPYENFSKKEVEGASHHHSLILSALKKKIVDLTAQKIQLEAFSEKKVEKETSLTIHSDNVNASTTYYSGEINLLKLFLHYKNKSFSDIPLSIKKEILTYLSFQTSDLILNKQHRIRYCEYLNASKMNENKRTWLVSMLKYVAGFFVTTSHVAVMKSFEERMMFLESHRKLQLDYTFCNTQKVYLTQQNNILKEFLSSKPETAALIATPAIFSLLTDYSELKQAEEKFLQIEKLTSMKLPLRQKEKTVVPVPALPLVKSAKSELKLEIAPKKMKSRLANKIKLKEGEIKFFKDAVAQAEKESDMNIVMQRLYKADGLSEDSSILLDEVRAVLEVVKTKDGCQPTLA